MKKEKGGEGRKERRDEKIVFVERLMVVVDVVVVLVVGESEIGWQNRKKVERAASSSSSALTKTTTTTPTTGTTTFSLFADHHVDIESIRNKSRRFLLTSVTFTKIYVSSNAIVDLKVSLDETLEPRSLDALKKNVYPTLRRLLDDE